MSVAGEQAICTFNKKIPFFQPNIYVCPVNSTCCLTSSESKCCSNEISFEQNTISLLDWLPVYIFFFVVVVLIWFNFGDANPTVPETCRADLSKVKSLATSGEKVYGDIVEDPVFGRLYHRKVSKKAYMEKPKE